jgi:hypothetical protein
MRLDSSIRLVLAQVLVPPGFTVVKMEQKDRFREVILLDKSEYTVFAPGFEGKENVYCRNC